MSVGVEALFSTVLGLQAPWPASKVCLIAVTPRNNFTVFSGNQLLVCPERTAPQQSIHDQVDNQMRHLNPPRSRRTSLPIILSWRYLTQYILHAQRGRPFAPQALISASAKRHSD